MRAFLVAALALACAACVIESPSYVGYSCDPTHPCPDPLVCTQGKCASESDAAVAPSDASAHAPDAAEAGLDAGPLDAGALDAGAAPDAAELPVPDAGQPSAADAATCSAISYKSTVLSLPGLVSYWRLDEKSGTTAKDSFGSNDGTYSNVTLGAPGLLSGDSDNAISFDGTSGQVDVKNASALNLAQTMTLGAILKPSAVDGKRQIIALTSAYWIQIDSGGIEFAFVDASGTIHSLVIMGGLAAGTVAHVVGTYDGQAMRVYVNGAEVGALPATAAIASTTNDLRLGSWGGSSNFFSGVLDEAFVANQAATAAEVAALYAAGTAASHCGSDAGVPDDASAPDAASPPDAGKSLDAGASDGSTSISMAVGLNGGGWGNAGEQDIKNAVNYVRLEDPTSVSYEASIGLKVDVLTELGGYNTNGVSGIDANGATNTFVTWWKANCTAATCPTVEVLNEPSGSWFWGSNSQSAANIAAYANLVKVVHDAFVAAGGERPLILASWENQNWGQGWFPTGGAYVDGVVVHPYGGGCGTNLTQSAQGNRTLVTQAHTGSGKPVYVTEVGWPTAVGQPCTGDSLQWSEADQATNITNFITWAEGTGYVNMVLIFGYRDYGTNAWYGVEHADGTKKPSYSALQALATP